MTIFNSGKGSPAKQMTAVTCSEVGRRASFFKIITEQHRRVKLRKLTSHLLPSAFVLTGALGCAAYSQANPAAIAEAVGTGVKAFGDVVKIYNEINPPQAGYTTVINSSNDFITVRSYNNNDWAMVVAAGQLNLKPGASGMIAAKTDPLKLVWKRGNFGTLQPFGTVNLSQSTAPKGTKYVFVIGKQNTN
jgi:hypothetical protein